MGIEADKRILLSNPEVVERLVNEAVKRLSASNQLRPKVQDLAKRWLLEQISAIDALAFIHNELGGINTKTVGDDNTCKNKRVRSSVLQDLLYLLSSRMFGNNVWKDVPKEKRGELLNEKDAKILELVRLICSTYHRRYGEEIDWRLCRYDELVQDKESEIFQLFQRDLQRNAQKGNLPSEGFFCDLIVYYMHTRDSNRPFKAKLLKDFCSIINWNLYDESLRGKYPNLYSGFDVKAITTNLAIDNNRTDAILQIYAYLLDEIKIGRKMPIVKLKEHDSGFKIEEDTVEIENDEDRMIAFVMLADAKRFASLDSKHAPEYEYKMPLEDRENAEYNFYVAIKRAIGVDDFEAKMRDSELMKSFQASKAEHERKLEEERKEFEESQKARAAELTAMEGGGVSGSPDSRKNVAKLKEKAFREILGFDLRRFFDAVVSNAGGYQQVNMRTDTSKTLEKVLNGLSLATSVVSTSAGNFVKVFGHVAQGIDEKSIQKVCDLAGPELEGRIESFCKELVDRLTDIKLSSDFFSKSTDDFAKEVKEFSHAVQQDVLGGKIWDLKEDRKMNDAYFTNIATIHNDNSSSRHGTNNAFAGRIDKIARLVEEREPALSEFSVSISGGDSDNDSTSKNSTSKNLAIVNSGRTGCCMIL